MKTTLNVLLAASILVVGCSSNPDATEADATATAAATATADMDAPPVTDATATASATASAPPAAPAPEPAADIAVVVMKVTIDPKTSMDVKADKGIYFKAKKIASFDKNVLQLTEMKDNITVWKDGTISMSPASPKKMKFNDKDEVEIEGGGKIAIDDKGKVTMTMPDAKDPAKAPKPVITGFKPEARRAATLTLVLALMSMTEDKKPGPGDKPTSAPPAPPSSTPPAVSANPPPKK